MWAAKEIVYIRNKFNSERIGLVHLAARLILFGTNMVAMTTGGNDFFVFTI